MTRREASSHRRPPYRIQRQAILVVCGGVQTEPRYFDGLKQAYRNTAVNITIKKKGACPEDVMRYALKLRDQSGSAYDECWCVLDVDDFDLMPCLSLARKNLVNLAISNPCFEYWLLLHFEACSAPLARYHDAVKRLLKHVPHYEKSALKFADFSDGVVDAVERARRIGCDPGTEHERNPSSGVWTLVENLMRR